MPTTLAGCPFRRPGEALALSEEAHKAEGRAMTLTRESIRQSITTESIAAALIAGTDLTSPPAPSLQGHGSPPDRPSPGRRRGKRVPTAPGYVAAPSRPAACSS